MGGIFRCCEGSLLYPRPSLEVNVVSCLCFLLKKFVLSGQVSVEMKLWMDFLIGVKDFFFCIVG